MRDAGEGYPRTLPLLLQFLWYLQEMVSYDGKSNRLNKCCYFLDFRFPAFFFVTLFALTEVFLPALFFAFATKDFSAFMTFAATLFAADFTFPFTTFTSAFAAAFKDFPGYFDFNLFIPFAAPYANAPITAAPITTLPIFFALDVFFTAIEVSPHA